MTSWFELLIRDLTNAVLGLQPADFAFATFVGMWFVILLMPLIGVDRRDPIAGAVFTLYCVASGAALVYALPQEIMKETDLKTINTTLTFMGIAAAFRWVKGKEKSLPKEVILHGGKQK